MAVEDQGAPKGPFTFSKAVELARRNAENGSIDPVAFDDETWPGRKGSLSWDPKANNGEGAVVLHPYDQQRARQSVGPTLSVGPSGASREIDSSPESGINN